VLLARAAVAALGGIGAAALVSTDTDVSMGSACGDAFGGWARPKLAQPALSITPTTAPIRTEAINASATRRSAGRCVIEDGETRLREMTVEFMREGWLTLGDGRWHDAKRSQLTATSVAETGRHRRPVEVVGLTAHTRWRGRPTALVSSHG
jgi:hypothetical protein